MELDAARIGGGTWATPKSERWRSPAGLPMRMPVAKEGEAEDDSLAASGKSREEQLGVIRRILEANVVHHTLPAASDEAAEALLPLAEALSDFAASSASSPVPLASFPPTKLNRLILAGEHKTNLTYRGSLYASSLEVAQDFVKDFEQDPYGAAKKAELDVYSVVWGKKTGGKVAELSVDANGRVLVNVYVGWTAGPAENLPAGEEAPFRPTDHHISLDTKAESLTQLVYQHAGRYEKQHPGSLQGKIHILGSAANLDPSFSSAYIMHTEGLHAAALRCHVSEGCGSNVSACGKLLHSLAHFLTPLDRKIRTSDLGNHLLASISLPIQRGYRRFDTVAEVLDEMRCKKEKKKEKEKEKKDKVKRGVRRSTRFDKGTVDPTSALTTAAGVDKATKSKASKPSRSGKKQRSSSSSASATTSGSGSAAKTRKVSTSYNDRQPAEPGARGKQSKEADERRARMEEEGLWDAQRWDAGSAMTMEGTEKGVATNKVYVCGLRGCQFLSIGVSNMAKHQKTLACWGRWPKAMIDAGDLRANTHDGFIGDATAEEVKDHVRVWAEEKGKWVCTKPNCTATFDLQDSLTRHLRVVPHPTLQKIEIRPNNGRPLMHPLPSVWSDATESWEDEREEDDERPLASPFVENPVHSPNPGLIYSLRPGSKWHQLVSDPFSSSSTPPLASTSTAKKVPTPSMSKSKKGKEKQQASPQLSNDEPKSKARSKLEAPLNQSGLPPRASTSKPQPPPASKKKNPSTSSSAASPSASGALTGASRRSSASRTPSKQPLPTTKQQAGPSKQRNSSSSSFSPSNAAPLPPGSALRVKSSNVANPLRAQSIRSSKTTGGMHGSVRRAPPKPVNLQRSVGSGETSGSNGTAVTQGTTENGKKLQDGMGRLSSIPQ